MRIFLLFVLPGVLMGCGNKDKDKDTSVVGDDDDDDDDDDDENLFDADWESFWVTAFNDAPGFQEGQWLYPDTVAYGAWPVSEKPVKITPFDGGAGVSLLDVDFIGPKDGAAIWLDMDSTDDAFWVTTFDADESEWVALPQTDPVGSLAGDNTHGSGLKLLDGGIAVFPLPGTDADCDAGWTARWWDFDDEEWRTVDVAPDLPGPCTAVHLGPTGEMAWSGVYWTDTTVSFWSWDGSDTVTTDVLTTDVAASTPIALGDGFYVVNHVASGVDRVAVCEDDGCAIDEAATDLFGPGAVGDPGLPDRERHPGVLVQQGCVGQLA